MSVLKYAVMKTLADELGAQITALSLGSPDAPTVEVIGTSGSTTAEYRVVAISRGGKATVPSSAAVEVAAPDSPDEESFCRVTWAAVTNAGGYLLFRDGDGIIARVGPGEARSVDDTGLAGDGSAIPAGTAARVEIGQGDPDNEQDYPSVVIEPHPFKFEPELGCEEVEDESLDADGLAVQCVGNWTGSLEIRVSAKDRPQREALQAAIEGLFFSQEGRRGIAVLSTPPLTLGGTLTTVEAPVAYTLSDSDWQEEFAFTKRRWMFIDVDVEFQALVVVSDTYTIEDMQLSLQVVEDLELTVNDETVQIVLVP